MNNMQIYEAVRSVPESAKRPIKGGRLKGFTDINPMFRIKSLTEQFGPAGIGWYTEMVERWTEAVPTGEVIACVRLMLYIKVGDAWSAPIEGEGGAMLIAKERGGLYASDEAWKMAKTDALSVCCKALGIGADVYWQEDRSKYVNEPQQATPVQPVDPVPPPVPPQEEIKPYEKQTLLDLCAQFGVSFAQVAKQAGWVKGEPWTREYHSKAQVILKGIEDGVVA